MLKKENIKNIIPMSPLQEAMYFRKTMDEKSSAYFNQIAFTLKGCFDFELFCKSWQLIFERHDALRTAFVHENAPRPLQIILKERKPEINLQGDFEENKFLEYKQFDLERGFNFKTDPLMRFSLWTIDQDTVKVLWSFHHIIMDGWCNSILFSEFKQIYSSLIDNKQWNLDPASSYSGFIKWIESIDKSKSESYWREYLSDFEEASLIAKKNDEALYSLSKSKLKLDTDTSNKLKEIAQIQGLTLTNLIKAIWSVIPAKLNDTNRSCFAYTISGRDYPIENIEKMVGLFINTLPQFIDLDKHQSIPDLAKSIQNDDIKNKEYGFVAGADIASYTGKDILYDHILIFENYPIESGEDSFFEYSDFEDFEQTDFSLALYVSMEAEIKITFKYNKNEISDCKIDNIRMYLKTLVFQFLANAYMPLADYKLLSKEEETEIIKISSGENFSIDSSKDLAALFKSQVINNPDKVILVTKNKSYTYKQVDLLSNSVANMLMTESSEIVGVYLERSELIIVSILGILKAGKAFLPLSTEHPFDRNQYIIRDSDVKTIISDQTTNFGIKRIINPDNFSEETLHQEKSRDISDTAYLIYTSGTTGKPKGVLLKQENLISFTQNLTQTFGIDDQDSLLAITTHTFDISILEMISTLLVGIKVYFCDKEEALNPKKISEIIEKYRINTLQITPSHLAGIIDVVGIEFLNNLKTILVGGEEFPISLMNSLESIVNTNIYNVYGPTETCIWSTAKLLKGEMSIGHPLLGEKAYILDRHNHIMPQGYIGEICIGGIGVGVGYHNKKKLSQERFIQVDNIPDSVIYKTGDYGYYDENKEIKFVGRKDFQLKVRGFRIEEQEIVKAILSIDSIKDCVILKGESDNLIAYLVANKEYTSDYIKRYLNDILPKYMIPDTYMFIDNFPLNANGKIDRNALPKPNSKSIVSDEFTTHQYQIASVWSKILGHKNFDSKTSFMTAGGHSLKAMRLVALFNKKFEKQLEITAFMKEPTIEFMETFLQSVEDNKIEIKKLEKAELYIPSSNQKRLWVLQKHSGSSVDYNMPSAFLIKGNIDLARLENAFNKLIQKYDILRTRFIEENGEPYLKVSTSLDYKIPKINIYDIQACKEKIENLALRELKLDELPLFDVRFFSCNEDNQILYFNIHHSISDGWSQDILFKEWIEIYNGKEPLDNHLQYQDLIADIAKNAESLENKEYWLHRLSGFEKAGSNLVNYEYSVPGSSIFRMDLTHLSDQEIRDYCNRIGISIYSYFLGLTSLLLKRYSDTNEVCFATVSAGRDNHDLQIAPGYFANTMVFRSKTHIDESSEKYLKNIQNRLYRDLEHQHYPYDKVLNILAKESNLNINEIVDTIFVFQENEEIDAGFEGTSLEQLDISVPLKRFGLAIHLARKESKYTCEIIYENKRFSESMVARMCLHLQQLSREIIDNPTKSCLKLDMISSFEEKLYQNINENYLDFDIPQNCFQIVNAISKRNADSCAVISDLMQFSYKELIAKTNEIAEKWKAKHKIKRGDVIAFYDHKTPEMIPAILAIWKLACTYLPIDAGLPQDRVTYILEDSNARFITNSHLNLEKNRAYDEAHSLNLDAAYIIYTSGTTGRPKGVAVKHSALANTIFNQIEQFEIQNNDSVLQFASLSFDASISEICQALFSGATLAMPHAEKIQDPEDLAEFMKKFKVSVATIPPSMLGFLKDKNVLTLKSIISAGEQAVKSDMVYFSNIANVFNAYGPTETAICSTIYRVNDTDIHLPQVPIGKPLANTQVLLLDSNMNQVPVSSIGDLYLYAPNTENCYFSSERLNKEAFIQVGNQTYYKSGDRTYSMETGDLVFAGRSDDQVKVRGYRIEPQEISKAIKEIRGVSNAFVLIKGKHIQKQIVAFIVGKQDERFIRDSLRRHLPDYMIPSEYVFLDRFPLNKNGKIDKITLQLMNNKDSNFEKIQNEDEKAVIAIMAEVTGNYQIEVEDSFFESGGNSLLVILFRQKLETKFRKQISIADIYNLQSARNISDYLSTEEKKKSAVIHFDNGNENLIFAFPSIFGNASEYESLSNYLQSNQIIAFDFNSRDSIDINQLTDEIKQLAANRRFSLMGYSVGGAMAYLVAEKLKEAELEPEMIFMLDSHLFDPKNYLVDDNNIDILVKNSNTGINLDKNMKNKIYTYLDILAGSEYNQKISSRIVQLNSNDIYENDKRFAWQALTDKKLEVYQGLGMHSQMLSEPYAFENAVILNGILSNNKYKKDEKRK